MKHNWVLLVFVWSLISTTGCLNAQQKSGVKEMSVQELALKVKSVQILDVRSNGEIESGVIKNTRFAEYGQTDMKQKLAGMFPDKKQPIVVYCHAGGRSAKVARTLAEMGYAEVYNLSGGIVAWRSKGNLIVNK
jgi:rhodanese-related sulfurtransferase